ncbi:MAG: sigma-70 family RNA polymerase sigma factor [Clostridiales Family XIII bacterium]|jgi:RNA polymerase sigma-70 factor (ECF subfamily)|nr:sigma-70 family RNA polymerase sigma factor [Clostridiales Family XIII bacterium]
MKQYREDLRSDVGNDSRRPCPVDSAASVRSALTDGVAILVRKAQKGDLDAFEQLCREKYEWAFSHAKRLLNNYHDAEDVTQNAFINVYRKLGSLKNPEAFDGWLYRIVRNECSCVYAMQNRLKNEKNLDDCVDELPEFDEDLSPSHHAERQEQRAVLRSIVDDLPPKRRKMIELSYYEDKSNVSIASEMRVSQSTVASTLSRARNDIKDRLENHVSATALYNYGAIAAIMEIVKDEAALTSTIPAVSGAFPTVKALIAECAAGVGKTTALLGAGAAKVVCVGVLTISAATVAIVAPLSGAEEPAPPPVEREPVVAFDAGDVAAEPDRIDPADSFLSGDNINPSRVALTSNTPLGEVDWRIVRAEGGAEAPAGDGDAEALADGEAETAGGVEVYSGVGSEVTEPLAALLADRADGDYEIIFRYPGEGGDEELIYAFKIVTDRPISLPEG